MSILIWVFIDILLYACMILPFLFHIRRCQGLYTINPKRGREFYSKYLILLILFCIFDKTSGDYFHYKEYVNELINYKENYSGLEDIYFYIIKIVGGSYFLFRLVVWGSAVLIYFKSSRVLNIEKSISVLVFLLLVLLNFSYARVSLAIVLFILGYILLCRKTFKGILLGGLIIISSLYFHKSVYILVPIAFVSFVPLNRKTIIAIMLAFPFCIYLGDYLIGDFVYLLEDRSAELNYLSQERKATGIAEKIEFLLLFGPVFIFLYKLINNCFRKRNNQLPFVINKLVVFSFYILYVSFILYFLDIGSNAIYYRVRNMVLIPFSFVVAYYISNIKLNRFSYFALVSLFMYNFYHMFYMYYLKTLGLGV